MTIEELYKLYINHPVICTDTRKITAGCLFFALRGENFNGNDFAAKALEEGASFAVVDEPGLSEGEQYITVADVLDTLQQLASYHRSRLSIPVIAVTGTNGKTTTKELLHSVLSKKFKTHATAGNLNNHIGVPLTLLAIDTGIEMAVIEMGANHQKEIELLCRIARPDHGLITNVGKAHLEGFGDFEGVKKAKGELYDFLKQSGGTVFIYRDNPHLMKMYGERVTGKEVYYSSSSSEGLVSGSIVENDPFLTVDWTAEGLLHRVKTHLTGIYNLENILAAAAVGGHFGLNADEINRGLSTYVPSNNRSQIIHTGSNTLICDYYNANPSSMTVALDNLASVQSDKKVIILGDMFELGQESEAEHKAVIEKALATEAADRIFIGAGFCLHGPRPGARFFQTTSRAIEDLEAHPLAGAVILVKGSRGMKLEELIRVL